MPTSPSTTGGDQAAGPLPEQPAPVVPDGAVSVHDLVIADAERHGWTAVVDIMAQRKQIGLDTYGKPLVAHNGRDALQDAVEEVADAIAYVRQAMEEARPHIAGQYWLLLGLLRDVLNKMALTKGDQ